MSEKENDVHVVKISRRHWAKWLFWFIWLVLEIVFLQAAFASVQEYEPRAAFVFWGIFIFMLMAGFFAWIARRLA